jgi:uncharacterized membrane protein HdeD (DUF308 family)
MEELINPKIIIKIDKDFLLKSLAIIFIILGLYLSISGYTNCHKMCEVCTSQKLMPCFLLLTFVGITFIINGLIIYLYRLNKRENEKWYTI